jgi:hypothetical protein
VSAHKPYVQAACVCEKVLIEPDNVPSLIRIVDTVTIDVKAIGPGTPPPGLLEKLDLPVILTAFVSLKSGDVVGEYDVGLRLNAPDGTPPPVRKWPVVLNGGEHGANVRIEFRLPSAKPGLYWFDVLWGDEVLTRIPLRVKPRPTAPTAGADAPNETVTHQP